MDVDVESIGPESSLSPSENTLQPNEIEEENKIDPLKWTVSIFHFLYNNCKLIKF